MHLHGIIKLKIVGVTQTLGAIEYINADFLKWMDGILMRNKWRRLVLTGLAGTIFNPVLSRPSVNVAPLSHNNHDNPLHSSKNSTQLTYPTVPLL